MQITLQQLGKRYNRDWIFKGLSKTLLPGKSYAITGANGSGKSTLLQVIAGSLLHSEGEILYSDIKNQPVKNEEAFLHISLAAPYLELIEEMTARELLEYHSKFKPLSTGIDNILEQTGLQQSAEKQIRFFSSGMKQRLKLGQAFFSNTSVLMLDEPTTNLDESGIQLYKSLIANHTNNRLVIVCSNDRNEYDFCEEVISVEDYKNT